MELPIKKKKINKYDFHVTTNQIWTNFIETTQVYTLKSSIPVFGAMFLCRATAIPTGIVDPIKNGHDAIKDGVLQLQYRFEWNCINFNQSWSYFFLTAHKRI